MPVDAVTASASGLDPHISVAMPSCRRPAPPRPVARPGTVLELVDEHTSRPRLGFLGEEGVNVLELNIALDALNTE